jgi:hypothetical protein
MNMADSPIAFTTTTLLGHGGVGVRVTLLREVARKPRLTLGTAVSDAGVVSVSELVGASHCFTLVLELQRYWLPATWKCVSDVERRVYTLVCSR